MKSVLKLVAVAALAASAVATTPASAQKTYRALDTSGCVLDIGRTDPPNSQYQYAYVLRNVCDRSFTIHYEVNGQPRSATIPRNGEFSYPVLNGEVFELTAIEG